MNFYPRYIGDFQRDTRNLTLAEVGAYDRLLDHYYATETPLPVDPATLFRIAGAQTRREKESVSCVLTKLFSLHSDGWHHKRVDAEIVKARKRIADATKGATTRWKGRKKDAQSIALSNALHPHPQKGITTYAERGRPVGGGAPSALATICTCAGRGDIHAEYCPVFHAPAKAGGAA